MSKPVNGVTPDEWAKHLRPYGKRFFWKRHRKLPTDEKEPLPLTAKLRKRKDKKIFGIEERYKKDPSNPFPWYGFFITERWNSRWRWYHTARMRDQALEVLRKRPSYGAEYRPCTR